MVCLVCGQAILMEGLTSLILEQGEMKFILNEVPAWICPACGEAYLEEQVAARVLSQAEQLSNEGIVEIVRDYT